MASHLPCGPFTLRTPPCPQRSLRIAHRLLHFCLFALLQRYHFAAFETGLTLKCSEGSRPVFALTHVQLHGNSQELQSLCSCFHFSLLKSCEVAEKSGRLPAAAISFTAFYRAAVSMVKEFAYFWEPKIHRVTSMYGDSKLSRIIFTVCNIWKSFH